MSYTSRIVAGNLYENVCEESTYGFQYFRRIYCFHCCHRNVIEKKRAIELVMSTDVGWGKCEWKDKQPATRYKRFFILCNMYTVKWMQYVSVDKYLFTTCFHTLQLLKFDQPQCTYAHGTCISLHFIKERELLDKGLFGLCITRCEYKSNWLVCGYTFLYKPLHNHIWRNFVNNNLFVYFLLWIMFAFDAHNAEAIQSWIQKYYLLYYCESLWNFVLMPATSVPIRFINLWILKLRK
jgi:hypothetical protein